MAAPARTAFPRRQAASWWSSSSSITGCCPASTPACRPSPSRLVCPPAANRAFSSGGRRLFAQSASYRDQQRQQPKSPSDPSSSDSPTGPQEDKREAFIPPPIPEGVDPTEYERANASSDEAASSSGRGASVISEEDLLRKRRQQRSNNKSPGGPPPPRPWYLNPTTLVLGFIPVFTFGLGYWQIRRLQWKVSLIEELEDKLRREPMRLPKNINLDALPEFEFRLVELEGTFDLSRPIFLGPRVREGQMGYHLVVPFLPSNGGAALLINKGFVSDNFVDGLHGGRKWKDTANQLVASGKAEKVLALLPRIYPGNLFTPPNKPERNEWFHADPKQMAEYFASSGDNSAASRGVLPVYLEEIFDGHAGHIAQRLTKGIPIGREATIELRNQHAVYAATWFSLSAATAVMFALLVKRGR